MKKGFDCHETIALSVINPRAVVGIPVPPDLSPEKRAEMEREIDRINVELEARCKVCGGSRYIPLPLSGDGDDPCSECNAEEAAEVVRLRMMQS